MDWKDDVLSIQIRLQQNLIAVATIVNNSPTQQIIPAPLLLPTSGSYRVIDSRGNSVPTVAPDAEWGLESLPMLELPSGGVYSEALDLRTMFPAIRPGAYQLRFVLAAVKGDRATWRGKAEPPAVAFSVVR
jgi:hypothetical protein